MLYTQTVEPNTLGLLKSLMQKPYLQSFVLVGGTALALQIGHRKSVDLDFFTTKNFASADLLNLLLPDYEIVPLNQTTQSLMASIETIKVDFIRFKYTFAHPFVEADGIRVANIEDIAPMKLDAIVGRGSKKDFYDLFFLLQKYTLPQLLDMYVAKYPHQTIFHVVRSLAYFVDAESDPDPMVFDKKNTWTKVKKLISKHIQSL